MRRTINRQYNRIKLGVDGQHRARLRGLDARLDVGQQLGVVGQALVTGLLGGSFGMSDRRRMIVAAWAARIGVAVSMT
jgi:hypothetical protein